MDGYEHRKLNLNTVCRSTHNASNFLRYKCTHPTYLQGKFFSRGFTAKLISDNIDVIFHLSPFALSQTIYHTIYHNLKVRLKIQELLIFNYLLPISYRRSVYTQVVKN